MVLVRGSQLPSKHLPLPGLWKDLREFEQPVTPKTTSFAPKDPPNDSSFMYGVGPTSTRPRPSDLAAPRQSLCRKEAPTRKA